MLRNSSYLSKIAFIKNSKTFCLAVFITFSLKINSQIANYVSNGGFENLKGCVSSYLDNAVDWDEIDNYNKAIKINSYCFNSVPFNGFGFQYPKSGNSYCSATFLCFFCSPGDDRSNYRNKLKTTLQANKTYCVKFYVNINSNSSYGIDGFGAYFGDGSLDTIQRAHIALSYLNPQVKNPNNNIIIDTLNWVPITGTFVATGNEKYMVIGNFKSFNSTNTGLIQPTYSTNIFCDICLDDVSCIPIDLPAFAGEDKHIIPGETLYIGRQRDVGIDEACMWYKLPITITPTTPAIDTAAGIFVSPIVTTTYVVKQDICGVVKYDTVVVFKDGVGLDTQSGTLSGVEVYPQPASEQITLSVDNEKLYEGFNHLFLYNGLGQKVREEEVSFKYKKVKFNVSDLPEGVYSIKLIGTESEIICKRIVINK